MRRDSRILAFKLIFERLFNSQPFDEELWQEIKDKDKPFAEQIFEQYQLHKTQIQQKLSSLLVGYSLDRVHKVDLALLCETITEIDYIKTPPAVAINEALEIAKIFSTAESPKFLNGVLSSVIKNNAKEGENV